MDGWRNTKDFAMVVCQYISCQQNQVKYISKLYCRNVCVFTYTHLAVLIRYSAIATTEDSKNLLGEIFKSVSLLNLAKIVCNIG